VYDLGAGARRRMHTRAQVHVCTLAAVDAHTHAGACVSASDR
jgi:hypothetical protein